MAFFIIFLAVVCAVLLLKFIFWLLWLFAGEEKPANGSSRWRKENGY